MRDLNITLIQPELVWEDIESNIDKLNKIIDNIHDKTDLIVLPEMFNSGFSMNVKKIAQDMNGHCINWLEKKSKQIKADITGSIMVSENNSLYNRLVWVKPDGNLFFYDKKHLFRYAGEDKIFKPGNKNITVKLNGWNIRPFICYDLRFPMWTRNILNQYDVAIFVANWPESRACHWKTLLAARAIENQCYVIGVNRVGKDGNDLTYSGDSSAIDPSGKILFHKSSVECVYTACLSSQMLATYRKKFPFWKDMDYQNALC